MELSLIVADADGDLVADYGQHCWLKQVDLRFVRSGVACLCELRQSPPDVLALAADLPWGGSDGVLEVMWEDPALSRIPIILIDREPRSGHSPEGLHANVFGRLAKPFDADALVEMSFAAAGGSWKGLLTRRSPGPGLATDPLRQSSTVPCTASP